MVAAFDVNAIGNQVYEYNFGAKPIERDLSTVTARELQDFNANLFLMSPPCQPYTRQGHRRGSEDARAKSFLNLIEQLSRMDEPPQYLFIENVQGFEISEIRQVLIQSETSIILLLVPNRGYNF